MGPIGAARRVGGRLGSLARRGATLTRRVEQRVAPSLTVLAYHRVAEPEVDPWDLCVSPAHFAEHLEQLKAGGDVVPLRDGLARFRSVRRRQFAITFDDGYVDNLLAALPLLERHDAPATVFIPTGFIDKPVFWWDRLDRIVMGDATALAELGEVLADCGLAGSWARSARFEHRRAFYERLHDDVTNLDPTAIDERLDRVVDRLGLDETDIAGRPITPAELVTLARHPLVTIGAHTKDHRMLPKLDDAAVLADLDAGTSALDEMLGPGERVLAYPHGRTDRRVEGLVRRAGFRHALTTAGRPVSRLDAARRLPRVNPADFPGEQFADWLHAPA